VKRKAVEPVNKVKILPVCTKLKQVLEFKFHSPSSLSVRVKQTITESCRHSKV
jgi:hypothetical protein